MHVWRDNQSRIFAVWCANYGPANAYKNNAHRVAPRPIVGRWERKSEVERYLLYLERDKATNTFAQVMVGRDLGDDDADDVETADAKPKAKAKAKARPKSIVLDETNDDEIVARKRVIGKWSRRALVCFGDIVHWLAMEVSQRLSKALDHMEWVLKKYDSKKHRQEGGVCGDSEESDWSNLAHLVFGKAREVENGISRLLCDEAWADIILQAEEQIDCGNKDHVI